MELTTRHLSAGIPPIQPIPATRPSIDAPQARAQVSVRAVDPDCNDMRLVLARIDAAINTADPDDPDHMVILNLADLRQMDAWGIHIYGQSLNQYFDLGSLDNVDPRYPVTMDEALALRNALEAMSGRTCPSASAGRPTLYRLALV